MSIKQRLDQLHKHIITVAQKYGRSQQAVQLLAVSKARTIADIEQAYQAGQHCFGENYVQEALTKIQALSDYDIEWHYIGRIQSNKTKQIAEHFAWVQTVCDEKQAQRLNDQRPMHLPPLNVCIQVNISQEKAKGGIELADMFELAAKITHLPRLRLRGLMTIAAKQADFERQRQPYRAMKLAVDALQAQGFAVDTLSMGMSGDYEAAIAEGATMVRVGTAIFSE